MFKLADIVTESVHNASLSSGSNNALRREQQSFFRRYWHRWRQWCQRKVAPQQHLQSQQQCWQQQSQASQLEESRHEAQRSIRTALQVVGLSLASTGLELGKDFSYSQGSLILNDAALAHLQQALGPDQLEYIMTMAPDLLRNQHQTSASNVNLP